MTSRQPTLSVATISFNQAEYLERTILSVLNQKNVDIEYIIIDPGSTDGSRDIIEKYRPHITHILFEKDNGPADGLNKCLAKASGEFFYYLNSDDEVCPNACAEAVQILSENPQLAAVYGNGVMIDAQGGWLYPIFSAPYMTTQLYARGLAVVLQPATFYRTHWLRKVGGFNVENRTCWDGEALFDVVHAGGEARRVWKDWGRFRIYDESISGSGRLLEQFNADTVRIAAKIGVDFAAAQRSPLTSLMYFATRATDFRRLLAVAQGRLGLLAKP